MPTIDDNIGRGITTHHFGAVDIDQFAPPFLLQGVQPSALPACFPDATYGGNTTTSGAGQPIALLAAAYQGWATAGTRVCFAVSTSDQAAAAQLLARVLPLPRRCWL